MTKVNHQLPGRAELWRRGGSSASGLQAVGKDEGAGGAGLRLKELAEISAGAIRKATAMIAAAASVMAGARNLDRTTIWLDPNSGGETSRRPGHFQADRWVCGVGRSTGQRGRGAGNAGQRRGVPARGGRKGKEERALAHGIGLQRANE